MDDQTLLAEVINQPRPLPLSDTHNFLLVALIETSCIGRVAPRKQFFIKRVANSYSIHSKFFIISKIELKQRHANTFDLNTSII